MRPMFFAAALTLAANVASAELRSDIAPNGSTHVTLTNGCVYTQNQLRNDNSWSLIYTQAGTTAQCALTIYGMKSADPAPTPAPVVTETHVPLDVAAPSPAPTTAPAPQPSYVAQSPASPMDYPRRNRLKLLPSYVVGVFR